MCGYSGRKQCICMLLEGEGHAARRVITVGGCHKGTSGIRVRAEQDRTEAEGLDRVHNAWFRFGNTCLMKESP